MCVLGLISKHIRIRLASHSAIHRIPNLVVCQYLNLFYGTMHTYMYTNVCIKAGLLETSRFEDIKSGIISAGFIWLRLWRASLIARSLYILIGQVALIDVSNDVDDATCLQSNVLDTPRGVVCNVNTLTWTDRQSITSRK